MEKNFMSSKEKNITFHQVWEWIQKNIAIVLSIIPLLGALLTVLMRVAFRCFVEGQAAYFHVSGEQIILNYPSSIVSMLSGGVIGILYILCNIWSCRSILKRKTVLKKIKRLVDLTICVPLGILIIVNALILPDKSWGKEFISASISIIIVHVGYTIGVGGFIFHFVHRDLVDYSKISLRIKGIEEKIKKNILRKQINMKQEESEENTEDRKESKNKNKTRDFIIAILAGSVILIGVTLWCPYRYGKENVKNQINFSVTQINGIDYAVVMSDGESVVLKKCKEENGILQIAKEGSRKENCNGLWITKKQFKGNEIIETEWDE